MADQWYYAKSGKQIGPLTSRDLQQLASTGQLQPDDQVWKEGLKDWLPARKVKGLFPSSPPAASQTPPPLPPRSEEAAAEARPSPERAGAATGPSITATMKAAVQLAARQAERAKLFRVTLPAAFRALGRHLYSTGIYRADFSELHDKLDRLLSRIAALTATGSTAPDDAAFVGRAKQTAQKGQNLARAKVLEVQIAGAMSELGKAAFARDSDASGPADLVRPITGYLEQLEALDAELAQLTKSSMDSMTKGLASAADALFPVGLNDPWTPARRAVVMASVCALAANALYFMATRFNLVPETLFLPIYYIYAFKKARSGLPISELVAIGVSIIAIGAWSHAALYSIPFTNVGLFASLIGIGASVSLGIAIWKYNREVPTIDISKWVANRLKFARWDFDTFTLVSEATALRGKLSGDNLVAELYDQRGTKIEDGFVQCPSLAGGESGRITILCAAPPGMRIRRVQIRHVRESNCGMG